jgi:hypothetical protein
VPYPDAPGWYIPFGRVPRRDGEAANLTPPLHEGATARLFVSPPNNIWTRVRRASATLLFNGGDASARVVAGDSMTTPHRGGNFLSPVDVELAPPPPDSNQLGGMWLLPHPVAGAMVLSPRKRVWGDTAITWTTDNVVLILRRTSRTAAVLQARTASGKLVTIDDFGINPTADSSMGVDPDSVLRLSDGEWRIPRVGNVFRLGPAGPWVFVLFVSGYECLNHRLLRVDATSARMLTTEEHYYECTV